MATGLVFCLVTSLTACGATHRRAETAADAAYLSTVSTDEVPDSGPSRGGAVSSAVRGVTLAPPSPAELGGPRELLTLGVAIDTALRQNPDLLAIRAEEPVARAAYGVADTYPYNPQVQSQVLPYTRGSDGRGAPASQQWVVVQTFELAGQQGHRSAEAQARLEQVRHRIERARLDVVARTQDLFFTALYHRAIVDMLAFLEELNEQLVGLTRRRMKAGLASDAAVALAELERNSVSRDKRLADAMYEAALMDFRSHLGVAPSARVALAGSLDQWRWRPLDALLRQVEGPGDGSLDPETVLRGVVADLPDVRAARAGVAAATDGVALADAMRVPNIQVGPMWQRDDSSTQFWGLQAQVDLPVVNSGAPLLRQRVAELDLQEITAAQTEQKAFLAAVAAYRRYEHTRLLVERSRPGFPGPLEDELRRFQDAFEAGQIALVDVFAAKSSLLQARRSMLDLLREAALAAGQVTRTLGFTASQLSESSERLGDRADGTLLR